MEIMVINVLAIGDVANVMKSLSKITKKSKIYIVNFPKDGKGIFIHDDNVDRFLSYKVKEQVEYINKIKNNFDICIVMGTGERIAYLADLNYIVYYVGRDIDAPRFIKNSKESWFKTPLHKLNFLERKFYYNTFKNAIAHVSGIWVYPFLEKYTKNGIKMDMQTIDTELFQNTNYEIDIQKTKFTFFSPQRMGNGKGTDLLWKALKLCKTDFQILQVNWFDESNNEELKIKDKLLKELPPQVKLIPMIKRKKMPEYYSFADAIIGNMRIGTWELVDLEGVMCGKPVLSFSDPNHKLLIKGNYIKSPFLPDTNKPKDIAKIIDKIVLSKEFRDKLFEDERTFVINSTDKEWISNWWDELFKKYSQKYGKIHKNSSSISIKIRMGLFLIGNRFYWKKIKKLIKN
jgi:glycosyltransferase involved in cell wall biosynthesis